MITSLRMCDEIRYPFASASGIDECASIKDRLVAISSGDIVQRGYGKSFLICRKCNEKVYRVDLAAWSRKCPKCGFSGKSRNENYERILMDMEQSCVGSRMEQTVGSKSM